MGDCYAWRTGVIEFGPRTPRGAIRVVRAPLRRVRPIIDAVARHAYDGGTLLVPGIPEALTDVEAANALKAFQEQVQRRLDARPTP